MTSRAPSVAVSFAEWVCLALIADGSSHGWALGSELGPHGDIGRIWSLTRPLTYRAVDGLVAKGLVVHKGLAAGRGQERMLLGVTTSGRRRLRRWLDTPVEHVRDVRTELLVKLQLRRRAGLDNSALLAAQRELLAPKIEILTSRHADDDLVALWRAESAAAVSRFLERAVREVERAGARS